MMNQYFGSFFLEAKYKSNQLVLEVYEEFIDGADNQI